MYKQQWPKYRPLRQTALDSPTGFRIAQDDSLSSVHSLLIAFEKSPWSSRIVLPTTRGCAGAFVTEVHCVLLSHNHVLHDLVVNNRLDNVARQTLVCNLQEIACYPF